MKRFKLRWVVLVIAGLLIIGYLCYIIIVPKEVRLQRKIQNLMAKLEEFDWKFVPSSFNYFYPHAGGKMVETNNAPDKLSKIGEPAIPYLAEALQQSDSARLRRNAAYVLRKIGGPKSVDVLIKALMTEQDPEALKHIIFAMEDNHTDKRVMENFIIRLQKDPNSEGVAFIMSAFERTGTPEILPIILDGIKKSSLPWVREKGIDAIAKISEKYGNRSSILVMIECLGIEFIQNNVSHRNNISHFLWYKTEIGESLLPREWKPESKEFVKSCFNWWQENRFYVFYNGSMFIINKEAKSLGISVDEKTGKMIDPKDSHELTPDEIEQIKEEK